MILRIGWRDSSGACWLLRVQARHALLDPAQLLAGEQAVITATPPNDGELIGAQLAILQRKRDQAERERGRLLDAYQAALLDHFRLLFDEPKSLPDAV